MMHIVLIGLLCLVAGCTPLPNTHPNTWWETNSMADTTTVNVSTTGSEDSGDTSWTGEWGSNYEPIIYTLGTRSNDPKEMLKDYLRIPLRNYRETPDTWYTIDECFDIHMINNTMDSFYAQTKEKVTGIFAVQKKIDNCFDFGEMVDDSEGSETWWSSSGEFWVTENAIYQSSHDDNISHWTKIAEKYPEPLYILKTKSNDPQVILQEYFSYAYKVKDVYTNRCFSFEKQENSMFDEDSSRFMTNNINQKILMTSFSVFSDNTDDQSQDEQTLCGTLIAHDYNTSWKLGDFFVIKSKIYYHRWDTMGRVVLAQKE